MLLYKTLYTHQHPLRDITWTCFNVNDLEKSVKINPPHYSWSISHDDSKNGSTDLRILMYRLE